MSDEVRQSFKELHESFKERVLAIRSCEEGHSAAQSSDQTTGGRMKQCAV